MDTRVGQLTRAFTREDKNRTDAPIDVDHGVVHCRAGAVRECVELLLEFRKTLGERPQKTGSFVKCHRTKLWSALIAGMGENGGEVDAGGGCLRDDLTRRGIAHRNAIVPAALPGTAYIAL